MKYNYKKHSLFEILISLDEQGREAFFFCGEGSDTSFLPRDPKEPEVVYHYTNYEAFQNIIKTNTLYLTDLFVTNDYLEVRWFLKQFEEYISTLNVPNAVTQEKINLLRILFRLNLLESFAASFSTLQDELTQWRGYGNDGNGIAFGIAPCKLNITRNLPERKAEGESLKTTIAFVEINYNEQEQKEFIQEILNSVFKNEISIPAAAFSLAKIAYTCKSHKWISEKEWRILYTPFSNPQSDLSDQTLISKKHILNNKKGVKFRLPTDIIQEIIIGPKCNKTIPQIQTLLKQQNLDTTNIKIIKSEVSYR